MITVLPPAARPSSDRSTKEGIDLPTGDLAGFANKVPSESAQPVWKTSVWKTSVCEMFGFF